MLTTQQRYPFTAITERPKFQWPEGKQLAFYVALGIEEYAFGEGLTEDLMAGASKPDYVNTSWRDYGNRIGAFRLIDLLQRQGLPISILLNTEVYDHAPQLMDYARQRVGEVIAHGMTNSDTLAGRHPDDEFRYLKAVADRIAEREGAFPMGWSSPWLAHTDNTADLLKDAGYRYVLDLGMDDQPVWLTTRSGRLLCIPYALELNDSSTIIGRQTSATEFAQMIIDQFDEMLEASAEQSLVMPLVVHSFISGQPFRLRALRRALSHIARHRDEVWFTTPGQIADFIHARPELAV
jgi:peptidoglycan/xylan/chitin deacetylase (PgdA/CDA1 family)